MKKKLLIRFPNWVGDTIMALPTLDYLINQNKYHVFILIKESLVPLINNTLGMENIITLSQSEIHGILNKIKYSRMLNRHNFDECIILPPSFSSALLVFLAGIKIRKGYGCNCRSFLLTHVTKQPHPFDSMHLSAQYLKLAGNDSGIAASSGLKCIKGLEKETVLGKYGLSCRRRYLGINPNANFSYTKMWPVERFAKAGEIICQKYNLIPVIFGGPGELEQSQRCASAISGPSLILAGEKSPRLDELALVLSHMILFITNDTGPMHIAAAVKTPVVAVYGATSPLWVHPAGEYSMAVYKDVECAPCHAKKCGNNMECMKAVSVDEVVRTGFELLDKICKLK
ncbi:MAG: lipopolysaccharide heptosyltransferase II [bacterium]